MRGQERLLLGLPIGAPAGFHLCHQRAEPLTLPSEGPLIFQAAVGELQQAVDAAAIAITAADDRRGALAMEWGPFRWTAPIVVQAHE